MTISIISDHIRQCFATKLETTMNNDYKNENQAQQKVRMG